MHVVTLVHGNNGSPHDLDFLKREISLKFSSNNLFVLSSTSNHNKTSRGIVAGGNSLFDEVYNFLLSSLKLGQQYIVKMSFIGHSLGGLYCRYAIGRFHEARLASEFPLNWKFEMVGYYAICSPHLGSRRPSGCSFFKVGECKPTIKQ